MFTFTSMVQCLGRGLIVSYSVIYPKIVVPLPRHQFFFFPENNALAVLGNSDKKFSKNKEKYELRFEHQKSYLH
jgi:hypothetical protein